jgi:hypothetical protein
VRVVGCDWLLLWVNSSILLGELAKRLRDHRTWVQVGEELSSRRHRAIPRSARCTSKSSNFKRGLKLCSFKVLRIAAGTRENLLGILVHGGRGVRLVCGSGSEKPHPCGAKSGNHNLHGLAPIAEEDNILNR